MELHDGEQERARINYSSAIYAILADLLRRRGSGGRPPVIDPSDYTPADLSWLRPPVAHRSHAFNYSTYTCFIYIYVFWGGRPIAYYTTTTPPPSSKPVHLLDIIGRRGHRAWRLYSLRDVWLWGCRTSEMAGRPGWST